MLWLPRVLHLLAVDGSRPRGQEAPHGRLCELSGIWLGSRCRLALEMHDAAPGLSDGVHACHTAAGLGTRQPGAAKDSAARHSVAIRAPRSRWASPRPRLFLSRLRPASLSWACTLAWSARWLPAASGSRSPAGPGRCLTPWRVVTSPAGPRPDPARPWRSASRC